MTTSTGLEKYELFGLKTGKMSRQDIDLVSRVTCTSIWADDMVRCGRIAEKPSRLDLCMNARVLNADSWLQKCKRTYHTVTLPERECEGLGSSSILNFLAYMGKKTSLTGVSRRNSLNTVLQVLKGNVLSGARQFRIHKCRRAGAPGYERGPMDG